VELLLNREADVQHKTVVREGGGGRKPVYEVVHEEVTMYVYAI